MKKIIYSLLVAAGLASCSDSLEQTPIGVLAQGNLPASDEDAIADIHKRVDELGVTGRFACRLRDNKPNRAVNLAEELYRYSREKLAEQH